MRPRAGLVAAALVVLLAAGDAAAATFSDPTPNSGMTPSAGDPPAKWSVYPMQIPVTGMEGTITKVTARLDDWFQGDTAYTDIGLMAPDGTFVKLASDAGVYSTPPPVQAADHVNVIFDQDAPTPAPPNGFEPGGAPWGAPGSTVWRRPADYDRYADVFPDLHPSTADAPASLLPFNGHGANGTWRLYLAMAGSGGPQGGSIQGWSLDITTTGPPPKTAPPPGPGTGAPAPSTGAPPAPDTAAPVVSRVALDPARLRPARRGGSIGATGAGIGFRLSEPATISFDVDRLVAGRRVGRRCSTTARRGRRCTRVVPMPGSFTYAARAGDNVLRFTGRLSGRALSPGRYQLTGVATDAAGNRSRPFAVTVTVTSRRTRSATRPPAR